MKIQISDNLIIDYSYCCSFTATITTTTASTTTTAAATTAATAATATASCPCKGVKYYVLVPHASVSGISVNKNITTMGH
jgi:hypothetical protein